MLKFNLCVKTLQFFIEYYLITDIFSFIQLIDFFLSDTQTEYTMSETFCRSFNMRILQFAK